MEITELLLKNNRVQVSVDGSYAFSCTQNFIVKNTIYVGKHVEFDEMEDLKIRAQKSILEYKVTEYASRNRYSPRELERKINIYAQKRYKTQIDHGSFLEILGKLQTSLLYDEKSIVQNWISNYLSRKKSRRYITSQLMGKGFNRQFIVEGLSQIRESTVEKNLRTLLERKKESIKLKTDNKYELRQKLIKFSLSKGFTYKETNEVLGEIL